MPDLLLGLADGRVWVHPRVGSLQESALQEGMELWVGPAGGQFPLDVGSRAMPLVLDWDSDADLDLLCGAMDGTFRLCLNSAAHGSTPLLAVPVFLETDQGQLEVAGGRSAPAMADLDRDGGMDLISGNTTGALHFAMNTGSEEGIRFTIWQEMPSAGVPVDLPGSARSRPAVCNWNNDRPADLLVGSGDGLLRLYHGLPDIVTGLEASYLAAWVELSWDPGSDQDRYRVYTTAHNSDTWELLAELDTCRYMIDLHSTGIAARYRVTRLAPMRSYIRAVQP